MKARVTPAPALVALTVTAAVAAGCGSGGPDGATEARSVTEPAPLSASGAAVIARTREAVNSYCVHVGARVASGREPDPARFALVLAEVRRLERLAADRPLAQAPDGSTPRFALGDIAEDLEGSNCDSRLARQIDDALATLPSG